MEEDFLEKAEEYRSLLTRSPSMYTTRKSISPKLRKIHIFIMILAIALIILFVILFARSKTGESLLQNIIIYKSLLTIAIKGDFRASNHHIVKAKTDQKIYKAFQLPNEIKVIVVSDVDSQFSLAALSVEAGSSADPSDMQGLAHFCEHLVFLKSEKYSELNAFSKMITSHSGKSNAFTKADSTNFFFRMASLEYEEALNRFSRFFIDPVFTEELMKGEVSAIDGELNRNLNDDGWKFWFLLRTVADPESKFSNFNIGSSESLVKTPQANKVDIVQRVKDYYNNYYSANLMTLVLVDNRPVDEIEDLARKVFNNIPNKKRDELSYADFPKPFTGQFTNKLVQYVQLDPIKSLKFIFSVDSTRKHLFLKPYDYLTQLVLNRGKGSLFEVLKDQSLIEDISGGSILTTKEFEIYYIEADLTDEGFKHVESITKTVFAFLDLVMKQGITPSLYGSYAELKNNTFNYLKGDDDLTKKISTLALDMHIYPAEYSVSGSNIATSVFQEDVLKEYIGQINVDNVLMVISSPDFNTSVSSDVSQSGKTKKHKKIHFKDLDEHSSQYNIDYAIQDLSPEFLEELRSVSYKDYPDLQLPNRNHFISKDFTLVDKPCPKGTLKCVQDYQADKDQIIPDKVLETDYIRTWHDLDRSGESPRTIGNLLLNSEKIHKHLSFATAGDLKNELIKQKLQEELFEIQLAGNSVFLSPTQIKVQAFSDVFPNILMTLIEKHHALDFNEHEFETAKSLLSIALYEDLTNSPFENVQKYMSKLMCKHYFLASERRDTLNNMSFSDFKELEPELFSEIYVETLFMGNILGKQSKHLSKKIVDVLDYKPLGRDKAFVNPVYDINGHNIVYRSYGPIDNTNQSYILNSYQDGIANIKNISYLNLLVTVLQSDIFTYLRTEQQICYLVSTYSDKSQNVISFNILVESHSLNPNEIDEQIEIVLEKSEEKLRRLTDEEFSSLVDSFNQSMSNSGQSLAFRSERYWSHISSPDYVFDVWERIVNYLPKVTKAGLLDYFTNLVRNPRKMSVQFYNRLYDEIPTDVLPKAKQLSGTKAKVITAFEDMKTLGLKRYPVLEGIEDE